MLRLERRYNSGPVRTIAQNKSASVGSLCGHDGCRSRCPGCSGVLLGGPAPAVTRNRSGKACGEPRPHEYQFSRICSSSGRATACGGAGALCGCNLIQWMGRVESTVLIYREPRVVVGGGERCRHIVDSSADILGVQNVHLMAVSVLRLADCL